MSNVTDQVSREYTISEAAEYLNIGYSTVHSWINRKWLVPDIQLPSGRVRFYQETLDACRKPVEKIQIETPAQRNRRAINAKKALYKKAGLPMPEKFKNQ